MLGCWPEIGRSKTRLAASLGGVAANTVYRQLLRLSANHAREASILPNRKALFFVDPPERARVMTEWIGNGHEVHPQMTGDLGRRMRGAAEIAFEHGADALVIMGSDCPHLTPERLEWAFDALTTHKVVLGPSTHGGFYLLGLSEMVPELFRPLQWKAERVLQSTRNRCRRLGIQVAELEPLPNIDHVDDLTDEVLAMLNVPRSELFVEAGIS